MNRTMRRLAILFAAVCVLLIMAVPAFATADPGYYVIGSPVQYNTTDEVNVKLVIQSREYSYSNSSCIDTIEDVTLTGKTSYTVLDVLLAFNDMDTGIQACDNNSVSLTSSATTVGQFVDDTGAYGYLFFGDYGKGYREPCDGWMFRVNGRYPVSDTTGTLGGPTGSYIHQTPVAEGDVITFYFSCPFKLNNTDYSTAFVSANLIDNSGSYEVQLRKCNENHYNTSYNGRWTFSLSNCYIFADGDNTGELLDEDGNYVATLTFSTTTGKATLPSNLSSGTYYVSVPSTKRWVSRTSYSWFTGSTTVTCNCLRTTGAFDRIDL